MLARLKARFHRIKARSARTLAPVAPQEMQQKGLLFGVTTRPTPNGWTATAYGPDGTQRGRTLTGLTSQQMATLTLGGAQATDMDKALALAGAWDEACEKHEDNEGVIDHFADGHVP